MSVHPVILCGGVGARLWPASRPSTPKQFLPLLGEHSPFQATLLRLAGLAAGGPPLVVTGEGHAQAAARQVAELGLHADVLVEPQARDSAPAIAAAMALIAARDPEGLAVILACDHHIGDTAAFVAALEAALAGARAGHIVTLGVTPTEPSTAYGYIEPGAVLSGDLRRVVRFTEKPDARGARALCAGGGLWNSGNFVAAAAVLIGELERHAPQVMAPAAAAVAGARRAGETLRLADAFLAAPKISIDYAVMEKTDRAAVLPVSFPWSDLGAWDAVWAASQRDGAGNAVTGEAILDGAADCLIRAAPGRLVAAVGVQRLAVIVENDAVLVCALDSSQAVKAVAAAAARRAPAEQTVEEPTLETQGAWFTRWLFVNALPTWWALGADRRAGGFFEALDVDGRPRERPRRARVQARQSFVYDLAGAMGWPGPWREASDHAAGFLRRAFLRRDGLYRTLVGPDGAPADDRAFLYDQAFALLALAARQAVRPDSQTLADANTLIAAIQAAFRGPDGGLAETGESQFVSNPVMHLFEAVIAWAEVAGRGEGAASWRALARELAAFALGRLIDPASGAIAETYDPTWRPASASEVHPGHQFEWAWLLLRWNALAPDPALAAAAARLYAAGAKGVNPGGVTINALDRSGAVLDPAARLWPQTERLKAALALAHLAPAAERAALRADALQAAAVLRRYLAAPAPGLWYDLIEARGALVPGPAPASSFYHLIGAVRALATPPASAARSANGAAAAPAAPASASERSGRQAAGSPPNPDLAHGR